VDIVSKNLHFHKGSPLVKMRTYLHGFTQALPGVGDQFPGLVADVANEKSLVEVPMKVPVVHRHVHCKTKLMIQDRL